MTTTLAQQIEALEHRAKTGLVFAALTGNDRTFAFCQAQLHVTTLLKDGTAQRLAEKDAALGGYQANAVLNTAAGCLTDDSYRIPRAEVAQILANAGIQQAFDSVAHANVVTAADLENSAVATVNLNHEHAAHSVVGDDGPHLVHAGPPIDVVGYFAKKGSAA